MDEIKVALDEFNSINAEILSLSDPKNTKFDEAEKLEKIEGLENKLRVAEANLEAKKRHAQAAASAEPSEAEQKELQNFSLVKAIATVMGGKQLEGFEAEVVKQGFNDVIASGEKIGSAQIALPFAYLKTKHAIKNEMSVTGTPDNASKAIRTDQASIIDLMYANMPISGLATIFPGLTGDVSFPIMKKDADSDPAVVAEKGAATSIDPSVGELKMSPDRIPVEVPLTDSLLAQDSIGIENWVRNHLAALMAEYLEGRAINEILNTAGIGAVELGTDGGALTRSAVLKLVKLVKNKNRNQGSIAFLGNADTTFAAETTPVASGSDIFLMQEAGRLVGRTYVETELTPNNLTKGTGTDLSALIYGNFSDLYIGLWGGLTIMVNPYRQSNTGITTVEAKMFGDTAVAVPDSFAAIKDIIVPA